MANGDVSNASPPPPAARAVGSNMPTGHLWLRPTLTLLPTRREEATLNPLDLSLLLLRTVVGVVMFAHGYNHLLGGGRIAGTTRWFASLGMRPAALHAWTASLTELGAGTLLVLGLAVPLAGAAVVGVMVVAWITNHRSNGFFIFRPGEGYEYVLVLTATGAALCGAGGGRYSLDHLLGFAAPSGLLAAVCVGGGLLSAGGLLLLCWRPTTRL